MKKNQLLALMALLAITGTSVAGWDEGVAAYERGDYQNAFQHFKPLAEQGATSAQYKLGHMYSNGEGVPQDYVRAYMWASLAAAQMSDTDLRDHLAKYMTHDEIAEGQRLAKEWLQNQGQ